jgi:hypothetical protein
MITLTTSLRETLKAQDIIRDLNIARIFDIQEEQVASNCWTFTTFEEYKMEDRKICLDIENMLSKSGLSRICKECRIQVIDLKRN